MKKFFAVLIAVSLFASLACAEVIKVGEIVDSNSSIVATDKESGDLLWKSDIIMRVGKDYIYRKEVGEGITGKEKKYIKWVAEIYSQLKDGQLMPYRVKIVNSDKEGNEIGTIEKVYNAEKKQAVVVVDGKAQSFKFHDDLLDPAMMGTVLRFFPFDRKELELHVLTDEPTLYRMTMKNHGKETIKYKGKDVECNKLQMIPDLGLLNIIGAFVPPTYFYYTAEAPHELIQYEGLDGGLGTPYIVMEITQEAVK